MSLNTVTITATTSPVSAISRGQGFTGGSYNASTGVVTFTSADGLGFSTGDLRGDLTAPGTIGGTTPGAATFTTLTATGDVTFDTSTLKVDASNNRVGVGTASPTTTLDVRSQLLIGTATLSGQTAAANADELVIDSNGTAAGLSILTANTGVAYIYLGDTDDADVGYIYYSHATNLLGFGTNASTKAVLTAAGNFGVGTTAPTETLDVRGTAVFGTATLSGQTASTNADKVALDTNGTAIGMSMLCANTGTAYLYFGDTDSATVGVISYDHSADKMILGTGGASVVSITTTGTGIGTSSPAARLDAVATSGTIGRFAGTSSGVNVDLVDNTSTTATTCRIRNVNGVLRLNADQGAAAASSAIDFLVDNSSKAYLDTNGNLILGGSTAAASSVGNLHLINGTAPSAGVANGVVLYSEDVTASAELKVMDEAGNVTTLSPHNFSLVGGPSEEMAWAFYSKRGTKAVNVDMMKLARLVEKLSGETLVHIQEAA